MHSDACGPRRGGGPASEVQIFAHLVSILKEMLQKAGIGTLPEAEWSDAAPDEPALDLARPGAACARGGGAICARSYSRSPARLRCWGRDTGVTAPDREASARRSPTDRIPSYAGFLGGADRGPRLFPVCDQARDGQGIHFRRLRAETDGGGGRGGQSREMAP